MTLDTYQAVFTALNQRGDEMSQSTTAFAVQSDVIQDAEPTVVHDGTSHAPQLITPQQVMFSTAAAVSPRRASFSRRLIDAIRGVRAASQQTPARRHYPARHDYLESSRMSREMDRL
jgi:hypothetical protein